MIFMKNEDKCKSFFLNKNETHEFIRGKKHFKLVFQSTYKLYKQVDHNQQA